MTTTANPPSGDNDEVKKWQRQTEKYREQSRKFQRDALETEALKAELQIVNKTVRELATALKDVGGDEAKIEKVITEHDALNRAKVTKSQWLNQISEVLFDKEVEWDDEKLAKARQLWDGGGFEAAYAETVKVTGAVSADDKKVAELVAAELAKLGVKVDAGTPTSGSPSKVSRADLSGVGMKHQGDTKAMRADVTKMLDAYFKPR